MKSKKKLKVIIAIIVAVAIVVTTVALFVLQNTNEDVTSYTVASSYMNEAISTTGSLAYYDVEDVTIYSAVSISSQLVSTGTEVSVGDGLVTVSATGLASAITSAESAIDKYDALIAASESTTSSGTVTAPLSGRVKEIYATVNEDVQITIAEYGKLMTLSIDGYMAFDITLTDSTLKIGDTVYVELSNGNTVSGTVKNVTGTSYKILISDEYGSTGEIVSISGSDATAELYINSPIDILTSSGTVEEINVSVNSLVTSGRTLIVLNEVTEASDYSEYVEARTEVAEQLAIMIAALQNNTILSPYEGVISSIASSSTASIASIANADYMQIDVEVNELDILNVYYGMEAEVTIDALSTTVTGYVTAVATASTSSTTTTSYTVELLVERTSSMYSGMSASVDLIIAQTDDVIMIPIEALSEDEEGVYVYTNSRLTKKQYVTLGDTSSIYVAITEGLEVGDEIYYEVTEADESSISSIPSIPTTTDTSGMTGMTGMMDMSSMAGMDMSSMPSMDSGMSSGMTGGMGGR
ncbi:MAG: efflux RND transporter periplasmic adaptor subunit [Bacillota bacterium]